MSEHTQEHTLRAGLIGILAGTIAWSTGAWGFAQTIGDEAEMERLQNRAEEAIANGDADGAAMNIGKAALMASQLAARYKDRPGEQLFRGAEALFRAQEHAYRAMALFQRAGGQPPASSGVCGSMQLARQGILTSKKLLGETPSALTEPGRLQQAQRFSASATDWLHTIDGMHGDFQCR